MATEQVTRHPIKLSFWFVLILAAVLLFGWATRSVYLTAKPKPLRQARAAERLQNLKELQESARRKLISFNGFDLRLMSPKSEAGIPFQGEELVVIAKTGDGLHFRVFDSRGKRVLDKTEADFQDNTSALQALKGNLEGLWPRKTEKEVEPLSANEKEDIIDRVASIAGHKPYAWVNEEKGIVRIPIKRAMELVSQEWQNPDAGRQKLVQRVKKLTAKPDKPKASQFQ